MTSGAIKAPVIIPLRKPNFGKPKNAIDTLTKIELSSESSDVNIHFTINGTKPEPYQTIGDKSTYLYKKPFTLPSGKRTIKAIAVARDGSRQSNVVTKAFDVELIKVDAPAGDEEDIYGFLKEVHNGTTMDSATRDAARSYIRKLLKSDAWEDGANSSLSKRRDSGGRVSFSDQNKDRQGTKVSRPSDDKGVKKMEIFNHDHEDISGLKNGQKSKAYLDNATHVARLQRETDFLKCIECMAPRPSDPFARYCNICGADIPPLPNTRLPPPESGQLAVCGHCHSMVPMNLANCIVCEMPMQSQNQIKNSLNSRERLICNACGTANPPNMHNCLTCEARLVPDLKSSIYSPIHEQINRNNSGFASGLYGTVDSNNGLIACYNCGRQNNIDARFCDWCGTKPLASTASQAAGPLSSMQILCAHCTASNDVKSQFCAQCGLKIEPPPRYMGANTVGLPSNSQAWQSFSLPLGNFNVTADSQQNKTLYTTQRKPAQSDAGTQTVGIFYPSTAKIKQRETEEEIRAQIEKEMRDRAPLLGAVSPGKGYWRKQLDHIIAHLKAYTNNNAEFRALIGEPRMGKLLAAQIRQDTYELNVSLTFSLKQENSYEESNHFSDPHLLRSTNGGMRPMRISSGFPNMRSGSIDSFRSETSESLGDRRTPKSKRGNSASGRNPRKKKPASRSNSVAKDVPKLTETEKALFKEINKNGEGRSSEIQQLIDEGANPNVVNADGQTALFVAVKNKHKDAIVSLIGGGADVHMKFGDKGNTALHEAVLLGINAEEEIDTLLGCGANPQCKNNRNESPYDLAVKSKCESIIKRLAAKMGQTKLNRLLQPRQSDDGKNDF